MSKYEQTAKLTAIEFKRAGDTVTRRPDDETVKRILEFSPYDLGGSSAGKSCAMVVRHCWAALYEFKARLPK